MSGRPQVPRSKETGDWYAQFLHSTAGLYSWKNQLMTLLRRLVKKLLSYDDQSLARFDQAYRGCYRQTMQNRSVLDVGCGPGDHGKEVMESGCASHYLGMDISSGLIHSAVSLFPEHHFCVADGCNLPLQDRSIDVVITSFTFHHIEPSKRAETLKELMRVARLTVIVRDLFGVDRGFWGQLLYQIYYYTIDGSFRRYTLNEWHNFFQICNAAVTSEFHTDETTLVNRHCCFVIAFDDNHKPLRLQ